MAVLIDASILIEHDRGRLDLAPHLPHRPQEEFFLSVVTASELLHGVYRAVPPEVRAKRSAFVEAILARFPLLPVDLPTARAHAQVWAELVAAGKMMGPHDLWLVAICLAHGLTLSPVNLTEHVHAGGLMAYGPNYHALFRRAATYVDKIFKGAKRGDLPIEQPTRFELVINLNAAKAQSLTIPPSLRFQADEVMK